MVEQTAISYVFSEISKKIENNINETEFINELKRVSKEITNPKEIWNSSLKIYWENIFTIFEKPWKTAINEFAQVLIPLIDFAPKELQLSLLVHLNNALEYSSTSLNSLFITTLEQCCLFEKSPDIVSNIICRNVKLIINFSINISKTPATKVKNILKICANEPSLYTDMSIDILNLLHELKDDCIKFLICVEYLLLICSINPQFMQSFDNYNLCSAFLEEYKIIEKDVLSKLLLLEYLSKLIEIGKKPFCEQMVKVGFVNLISSILNHQDDPLFYMILPVCTKIFVSADLVYYKEVLKIIDQCLLSKPNSSNMDSIFVVYETIIYIISNHNLLEKLLESRVNIVDDVCTFLKSLISFISEERKGSIYLTFSHLFATNGSSDAVNKTLQTIFLTFISVNRLFLLLKSLTQSQQHSALCIILTTSSFDWGINFYIDSFDKIIGSILDPKTYFIGQENLYLRTDLLKKLINSESYKNRLTQEQKDRLQNGLIRREANKNNQTFFVKMESA